MIMMVVSADIGLLIFSQATCSTVHLCDLTYSSQPVVRCCNYLGFIDEKAKARDVKWLTRGPQIISHRTGFLSQEHEFFQHFRNHSISDVFIPAMVIRVYKTSESCSVVATPLTIQSMEFSKPEYWSGLPCSPPGHLHDPRIEPRSPHCRLIVYWLSPHGNPRILEWVAYPFSRASSQSRNQTAVSCIAGRFFTSWATRKAPLCS